MEGHHTRQILIRAAASYHSQCFKLWINLAKTPQIAERLRLSFDDECRNRRQSLKWGAERHPGGCVFHLAPKQLSPSQSPMRSTPPRLTHTNHHPQSRGPATCPCDRVRRRSASASADGESLKSPPFFPVNTHRGRGGRIGQQSASRHPCIRKRERGPDEGPNDVDRPGDVRIELSYRSSSQADYRCL